MAAFMDEWRSLYKSGSGERGVFNRIAAQKKALENGRRETGEFGCNPCGEIILRPFQFCNLSEVVVRAADTPDSLKEKVEIATILGTMQATLTNFKYLRAIWKRNTEEERLLGVSLTGICDSPLIVTPNPAVLERLKKVAIDTNKAWSSILGINQSVAITTVKPSGTVSQLVNAASGIHPRYASYYIRRVRADSKDPLTEFMKAQGIPNEPCAYKPESTVVFGFPIKSEQGTAIFRDSLTALQHLNLWLAYRKHWCEHNPSVTIQVKPNEWMAVGAWVYENFNDLTGVSFLPYDSGTYTQAPYEEITEEQYKALDSTMPKSVDWMKLEEFEKDDNTAASREFACTGDVCEIVDITK
jgi:ribonucleoside-diphosphate reductase alpha chain